MNIVKRIIGLDKPETEIKEIAEEVNEEMGIESEIKRVLFDETVLEEE